MIRVGLVGLPNAGKSTTFNFLTNANVLTAPYPFSTITPNKARLELYDENAQTLAAAVGANDIMYTEVEIWDIAGLIENASLGEGLGSEFLGQIKDCDILSYVVSIDENSTQESIQRDLATVMKEIALFDHKHLLKPFEKARRLHRLYKNNVQYAHDDRILTKAYYGTKDGQQILEVLSQEESTAIVDVDLISSKPHIVIFNIKAIPHDTTVLKATPGVIVANFLELSALTHMTEDDRAFLGYGHDSIDDVLRQYCGLLTQSIHSKYFYTVGHLGVGQWIAPSDANAGACSYLVHSDMEDIVKGVKVAQLADFIRMKSWANLTKNGLVRKYNPKYVPQTGDVLYFEIGA
jgi:small GTP-binding protein